jgi:proline iminopeptidase
LPRTVAANRIASVDGRLVEAGDTSLFVVERGSGPMPLFVLHGGPGLDHTMFGDHLDGLSDTCRLLFVDQRSQGRSQPTDPSTWTLAQMAADVHALADTLEPERYAVLGHSFGAFVALQHAVDFSGHPAASIISAGIPSARFLAEVDQHLAAFEPEELREQVTNSWAREADVQTQEECRALLSDQLPFHFRDPRDPRIETARNDMREMVFAPDVIREGARGDYGGIELEDRLGEVRHPVLVLVGRHERTCSPAAAEAIAQGIPGAELVVFEHSAHMSFIEEQDAYLRAVRDFLARRTLSATAVSAQ